MDLFRWLLSLCMILSVPIPCAFAADAGAPKADHVKISWIAPSHFTGKAETIGIRFEIEPQWHIYWKNPGDSGTAPRFDFEGSTAGVDGPAWPLPKRLPISGLTNIGYETEVVFPFVVTPHEGASKVDLTAQLDWLVCKEECLPGSGKLTLHRTIGKDSATEALENGSLLERALQTVPKSPDSMPWTIKQLLRSGDDFIVSIDSKNVPPLPLRSLRIFPVDDNFLSPAEPLTTADGESLRFKILAKAPTPDTLTFVVADDTGSWEFTQSTKLTSTAPASIQPTDIAAGTVSAARPGEAKAGDWSTYLILLLSAFVGGIILNLMPCVLPVLSIKFFSLAKVNAETRWREAMLYTLGVLITFTALGGVFLGLRAGGAAIGWGFQLQSPPVVTALIVLFWMMGLSFVGFYEFGNSLTRAAGKFENTGSFATGCLSVFIATPCTGPFMGTALGAAVTLPAFQALVIFFALGLGLASPFIALAWFPGFKLPKPGQWMITLRQFLAFPLFATVLWLLWVLGIQLGTDAWLYLSALGLVLTFSIWLGKERGKTFQIAGLVLALLDLGYTAKWVIAAPLASAKPLDGAVAWEDYDAKLILESQGRKQGVFVDFTASWCVTCQVNKKAVLETEVAEKIFAAHNVRLIRGDWTNLDDKITEALAAFNRASVPLYLYYPPDGSRAQILPQILTMSDIEGLFP